MASTSVPHVDVLLGSTKNITLVARINGVVQPNAVFSNVNYILDNPAGTIIPNADNPGLAVFKAGSLGDATLKVDAVVTFP